MDNKLKIILPILLLIVFGVYLYTLFPTLAPYRDSGEMATVIKTLGNAHSPGYPLYILLGKFFTFLLPFGNLAYRLNVLSAIATCLTCLFLYFSMHRLVKNRTTLLVVILLFATSYLQWYLSLVSEMYTLNTLFAAFVFFIFTEWYHTNKSSLVYLFGFLSGLFLGNRMDLLLCLPGLIFVILAVMYKKRSLNLPVLAKSFLFFLLGFCVYLYLPLRASQFPIFDWNHPANLERFLGSLTRKTHGGTLDLLSTAYAGGENFVAGQIFYLRHLLEGFAYIGIPAGLLGFVILYRRHRTLSIGLLLSLFISGPLFVYLGNMPPNTHALAILEAHFLLPNLIFFIFILYGADYIVEKFGMKASWILGAFVIFNFFQHFSDLNKRDNYFDYDYGINACRSLRPGSIAVIKEDVQLFSLWHRQFGQGHRQDLTVIGQGLAGSPWYQDMIHRNDKNIVMLPLRTEDSWLNFVKANPARNIYATIDVDMSGTKGLITEPQGIPLLLKDKKTSGLNYSMTDNLYVYRGIYEYDYYREFFTPDLIEDYAKARHGMGFYYMNNKKDALAIREFSVALYNKRLSPASASTLAFMYFSQNNYTKAKSYYLLAEQLLKETCELADKFNSLEDAKKSFKNEWANIYLDLGVTEEKIGNPEKALEDYSIALKINPYFARAYFNRAVIYWQRQDWQGVAMELETALSIDPNYTEAREYLEVARRKLQKQ